MLGRVGSLLAARARLLLSRLTTRDGRVLITRSGQQLAPRTNR